MLFSFSCSNSVADIESLIDTTQSDMTIRNMEVIYSSSALVKFKLTTPLLIEKTVGRKVVSNQFPQGVHIWSYDADGNLQFELKGDSAIHLLAEEKWRLRGNVVGFRPLDSSTIRTELVHWDQKAQKIYSDTETVINRPNQITDVVASGFRSDSPFDSFQLLYISQGEVSVPKIDRGAFLGTTDSLSQQATDSIAQAPRTPDSTHTRPAMEADKH